MLIISLLIITSLIAIVAKLKSPGAYTYTKALPIFVLIALAAAAFLKNPESPYLLWILLAITAGCAGDFLLLRSSFFIPGLLAFLLGHLFYAAAFLTRDWILPWHCPAGLIVVGVVYYWMLMRRMGPERAAKYRIPVALYFAAIAFMTAAAWNHAWYYIVDVQSRWLLIIGGAMFPLADGILGWVKFAGRFPGDEFVKSVTYYAAQALIILGALRYFA